MAGESAEADYDDAGDETVEVDRALLVEVTNLARCRVNEARRNGADEFADRKGPYIADSIEALGFDDESGLIDEVKERKRGETA